jgi:hypothetical protein
LDGERNFIKDRKTNLNFSFSVLGKILQGKYSKENTPRKILQGKYSKE